MSDSGKSRAGARPTATSQTASEKAARNEREADAKAVRDNMAKLKELRLAREAANPTPTVVRPTRTKPDKTAKAASKQKQALGDWLADQQKGGRRT